MRKLVCTRSILSACGIAVVFAVSAASLAAQAALEDRSSVEAVALYNPVGIAGIQAEYPRWEYVAPWASVRYGVHNAACELGLVSAECGAEGVSALAGVRIKAGRWGPVQPYVTLGAGRLWYNDGRTEATGTAAVGTVWFGFGRVRPRIEFGLESHVVALNIGIGYLF